MAGGARTACVWVLLLWLAAEIQGGKSPVAPAPSSDCTTALLDLADCRSYVQVGETVKKPEGQCCSNLKKVVNKEVSCLCDVFKQAPNYGINITKALTLPSACGLSTPSVSKCKSDIPGIVSAAAPGAPSSGVSTPSSRATGPPAPLSGGKSAAAAYRVPPFGYLTSMVLTLWLCCHSYRLVF